MKFAFAEVSHINEAGTETVATLPLSLTGSFTEKSDGTLFGFPDIDRPQAMCAILDKARVRLNEAREALARVGYGCTRFDEEFELLRYVRSTDIDLVLVMEPEQGASLEAFVAELRSDPAINHIPLVIVGPDDECRMVNVLAAGADAYITWPTSPELLVARIRALFRRICSSHLRSAIRSHGAYTFYTGTDRVCLDGERIWLTRMEYRAALLLFKRMSHIVTFADLWLAMWEGISGLEPQRRTVCVHMSRVRAKLRLSGEYGYQLISVRGSGYKLVPSANELHWEMMSHAVNY
ncbi:hypothetical protein WI80_14295 [Burkholderia ubonensis]|uniref:response regulator transcription factor n=1 Tax=Burkholderia ubonensis TaxID=101571 RepID=UPI00075C845D|nr:response regulator transcription factor [Burkholderia ubonensis]KVD09057.1 hypothetical protein WI80_14295 [Burkholderia ubonensis]KVU24409.1 hypothetical protein WK63_26860 [Burkholderia ubonensis]